MPRLIFGLILYVTVGLCVVLFPIPTGIIAVIYLTANYFIEKKREKNGKRETQKDIPQLYEKNKDGMDGKMNGTGNTYGV